MTREADQRLIEKMRSGQPITPLDHIGTIDSVEEIDAFRAGLAQGNRLTEEITQAIARRKIQIARTKEATPRPAHG